MFFFWGGGEFACSWLYSQTVRRGGGVGFWGAASSTHGLVRRTGISPNLPYFCICDSSGWASVEIRPRKACNYPNLRSFGWVSYDKVGALYSGKLGNRSEASASDLRSYPGLCWNRIKQRLYEGNESEYSPRTCSIGRPLNLQTCRGHSVSPPITLHIPL